MKIVAFSGKRESGKTTAADYLANTHDARILSFAGALRGELARIGYSRELLATKPTPEPLRLLMIAHGQARRWVNPDYWVSRVMAEMAHFHEFGCPMVVIDDLRFWNEAEALRTYGATLVRLECTTPPDFQAGVDDERSETDLDQWDDWDHRIIAPRGDLTAMFDLLDDITWPDRYPGGWGEGR